MDTNYRCDKENKSAIEREGTDHVFHRSWKREANTVRFRHYRIFEERDMCNSSIEQTRLPSSALEPYICLLKDFVLEYPA